MIVIFPIDFLIFINLLKHVIELNFQQLEQLVLTFFIQIVFPCKLFRNFF